MRILVTGAKGKLGKNITSLLSLNGFDVVPYSHSMSLSELDWPSIGTVINCAAVIPAERVTEKEYLDGNVVFLQELIKHSFGKNFIHFSTFSEIYRDDFYQRSKMIANSLLIINSGFLKNLKILPLPTLDDEPLIQSIVDAAKSGSKPKVDRLKYNYMSFNLVAEFVRDELNLNNSSFITEFYKKKDLYDEVVSKVDANLVTEGKCIDRTLFNEGVYQVMPELLNILSE
jgi:hypothetical protein